MAEISFHNVTKIHLTEVREHDTFVSRSIVIEDESGQRHEITLFSNNVDDDAILRVWL